VSGRVDLVEQRDSLVLGRDRVDKEEFGAGGAGEGGEFRGAGHGGFVDDDLLVLAEAPPIVIRAECRELHSEPLLAASAVRLAGHVRGVLGADAPSGVYEHVATIVGSLILGHLVGLAVGLVIGVIGGVASGLEAIHDSAAVPSEPHRQAMSAIGVICAAGAIVLGVPQALSTGSASAAAAGLLFGVPLAFSFARSGSWYLHLRTYAFGRWRAGDLPRDLTGFLDWAHRAGLMRLSGLSTQFRRREVQLYFSPSSGADSPAPVVERGHTGT
jgi:hypothetical protein